jgi:cellulose synthase/poly-beta-1,6-N-acetylglucosamine synthase-like glycosyltransferase
MPSCDYLTAARASDLKTPGGRFLYRMFEMIPGVLSWSTLVFAVLASWIFPTFAAFFILMFILYWLMRVLYFAIHLRSAYRRTKEQEKIDWLEKVKQQREWGRLYHLVVVPMYKEPIEVLRQTFGALSQSDYPKEKMIVVLGIEKRAGEEGRERARIIEREFGQGFFRFLATEHPADLPGEIAGKGSNETWAVKQVQEEVIDKLSISYEDIVISSLDADTVVPSGYFSCVAYHYLTSLDPLHHSYQPVPLFINNIWQASVPSRLFAFSTTFWFLMNQERPEKLSTFSSHSMPFKTLVEVGYRQVNYAVDDSRIFWQCFLHYNGNYKVQALYYPVSMDANAARTFWGTVKNIYKQQRRWAYGVADIPYFLYGFLQNKNIPLGRKFSLTLDRVESYWSWSTASLLIFIFGWMPLLLGGEAFSQTLLSYNMPRLTSLLLTFMMFGLVWSVYLSMVLLPPRPIEYGRWRFVWLAVQWIFLPPIMVFFAIPALDAQTRLLFGKYLGFWSTPKFRK